jgi:stage IV sporulation protein B
MREKFLKRSLAVINIAILILTGIVTYYSFSLPDNYYITDFADNKTGLPAYIDISKPQTDEGFAAPVSNIGGAGVNLNTDSNAKSATLTLFNIIPVKNVTVTDIGTPMLIPSGAPFGIKMLTDGVMVVDVNGFEQERGYGSPAKAAGIKPGDVIKTLGGRYVWSNNDVADVIKNGGGAPLDAVYYRDNELTRTTITPKRDVSGGYKIGMWVRDSSAGIGTITFFDPATGIFGGLGHPVCDTSSGALLPLYSGEAVSVSVNGCVKGKPGSPGELTGIFLPGAEIGKLLVNSASGVYGEADSGIIGEASALGAIPLGTRGQIEPGAAVIISTVTGDTPKQYTICIEDVFSGNNSSDGKDMIIRVDDPALIEATGGIVQGMSGSPIIQNGKLVGAVTHVFVNNPLKGYAIFADKMIDAELKI